MTKKREYRKATVELCRNCGGRGIVSETFYEETGQDRIDAGKSSKPCPVCDGRGRVWKVNAGTVFIEPFDGQE